jgi:hypothetical protein
MSAVVILVVVAVKAVVGQKSTQGWQSVLLVEGRQPHLPLDLPLPPFAIVVEAVIAQCPVTPQGFKDHGQRPTMLFKSREPNALDAWTDNSFLSKDVGSFSSLASIVAVPCADVKACDPLSGHHGILRHPCCCYRWQRWSSCLLPPINLVCHDANCRQGGACPPPPQRADFRRCRPCPPECYSSAFPRG